MMEQRKVFLLLSFALFCLFSLGYSRNDVRFGNSHFIQGQAPEPLHFHEMEEDEETENIFEELEEGKTEQRRFRKHHMEDGTVHYSDSSFTFHPRLKALDRKRSVKSIKCIGSKLVLKLSDEDFAESIKEGDRLYFGPKWGSGCHKHFKRSKSTHFSLLEVDEVLESYEKGDFYIVELAVEPLDAPALYKRAVFNIAYGVPEEHPEFAGSHIEKRNVFTAIKNLVDGKGKFDIDSQKTLKKTVSFKPTALWLVKFWGNVTLSLTAGLTVHYEEGTMKEFGILFDFGLDIVTKAQVSVTFSHTLWSHSIPIFTIPIPIPVGPGVFITLTPSLAINIGISISTTFVSNEFPVVFKCHLGKEIKYLNKPGEEKGWGITPLHDNPFTGTHVGLPTEIKWDSSALGFSVSPAFSLGIGVEGVTIGGPKITLPFAFRFSATSNCALNLNVTASVGISLDIDIKVFIFKVLTKSLISKQLWRKQIWGKCYTLSQLGGILKHIARVVRGGSVGVGPDGVRKPKRNPLRRIASALGFKTKSPKTVKPTPRRSIGVGPDNVDSSDE